MSLADYQRALLRASFSLDPDAADFERLGDAARFRMYRNMIRSRLRDMARVAFKQTLSAAGSAQFDSCFDRYLEARPPSSPLIREVVADFAPFARMDAGLLTSAPAYVSDLLRFEESKWRVAYVAVQMPKLGEDGVRELDFEGRPVLNPTLVLLPLEHSVHVLPDLRPELRSLSLLMYRPPGADEVRWYATEPLFAAIVERARMSAQSLAELVREAASDCALALDSALLESLSSALTLALSRGVILGVR